MQAFDIAMKAWKLAPLARRPSMPPYSPSTTWYQSFLKRKKSLKPVFAAPLEGVRHENATKRNFEDWFNTTLLPLNERYQYDAHMVANCDETMLQINSGRKVKIIAPKEKPNKSITEEAELTHITFVVTIFANGSAARSLIIFPMKTLPVEIPLEYCRRPCVRGDWKTGWLDR